MRKLLLSAAAAALIGVSPTPGHATTFGGVVDMGGLTDFLYVFLNGDDDVNINSGPQIGDIAVSGTADTRSSGNWDYSGNIVSGHSGSGDPNWEWDRMVTGQNSETGTVQFNQQAQIDQLAADFETAVTQAEALAPTVGYESVSSSSLNNLNTQNGAGELFVINVTSGFNISNAINIIGDADDFFIFRWDTDADPTNGYNGQVKFNNTTGITPGGDLTAANFLHLAGDLNSSGGSGGFFNGYWLTFGKDGSLDNPGSNSSFSNANFNGGWYTNTDKLSLTSGSQGTYVAPLASPTAVIPLPAAGWLLLSGLGLFAAIGRRRMRASA